MSSAPWTLEEDVEFRAAADAAAMNGNTAESDSWQPVDLAPILEGLRTGTIVGPIPTLLLRTDGVPLLYPGEVHSFAGEPESGKSWVAAAECARLVGLGGRVLYVDFEDTPASVIARLLALGAAHEAILDHFAYVRPDTPTKSGTVAGLVTGNHTLAVLDGLSEAYGLLGLDLEKNADAAKFLAILPRPIAAAGAAVIQIDHVTKSAESRGRYAIGAQHKLAGIAVAYSFEIIRPFSRTQDGTIKIRVEKDRHGHVRGHAESGVIALAQVKPQNDGERVTLTLEPPDTTSEGTFRPTVLMERVSRALVEQPGLSTRLIRTAVKGKNGAIDLAVELLIADGHIRRENDGKGHRHYVERPYREAADQDRAPVPRPCPDRAPGTGEDDRAPVPHPLQGGTGTGHGSADDSDHPTVSPTGLAIVASPAAARARAALAEAEAEAEQGRRR